MRKLETRREVRGRIILVRRVVCGGGGFGIESGSEIGRWKGRFLGVTIYLSAIMELKDSESVLGSGDIEGTKKLACWKRNMIVCV